MNRDILHFCVTEKKKTEKETQGDCKNDKRQKSHYNILKETWQTIRWSEL